MPHDHAHSHAAPTDLGPAFRRAVGLNAAYVIVEAAAGFLAGSLALLADAAHNLTDVAGLLIAWGPRFSPGVSPRKPTPGAWGARPSWRRCWTRSPS